MQPVPRGAVTNALVIANVLVWLVGFITGWSERFQIEGAFWSARLYDSLHGGGSLGRVAGPLFERLHHDEHRAGIRGIGKAGA